jgi:hypothetical protein
MLSGWCKHFVEVRETVRGIAENEKTCEGIRVIIVTCIGSQLKICGIRVDEEFSNRPGKLAEESEEGLEIAREFFF